MLKALAALIEFAFLREAEVRSPQKDTWDAAFAEARWRFPDHFQLQVDALAELQQRNLHGVRKFDA